MGSKTRRFGLGDLMILIAALGAATLGLRGFYGGLVEGADYWSLTPIRLAVATGLAACAMPLTLACLALRLRRPRPAWRKVALQPGAAAMTACAFFFACRLAELGLSLALPDRGFLSRISTIHYKTGAAIALIRPSGGNGVIGRIEAEACHGTFVASLAPTCGWVVGAVWLVISLSGRWRAERSWIDRLGRGLGVLWIVVSVLAAVPVTR